MSTEPTNGGAPLKGAPLTDRWEYAIALHEAGHIVVAHALGLPIEGGRVMPRDTTENDALGCVYPGVWDDERKQATVYLAGTVAKALGCGVPYQWLEYWPASLIASAYRANQKRKANAPPPKTNPQEQIWNVPVRRTPSAVGIWAHNGRSADVTYALDCIERTVTNIADVLDRDGARVNSFESAQCEAFRLCRSQMGVIEDLARHLCAAGGYMDGNEIETFFRQ